MRNSKFLRGRTDRRLRNGRYNPTIPLLVAAAVALVLLMLLMRPKAGPDKRHANDVQLWEIRSVDTMKTSRDKARVKLNDPSYDVSINNQLAAIKSLGANYVAVGTPYDEEFLPYLRRWVRIAREHDLNVWFRGNFSRWEGWFDYPEDMSPQEHLAATETFIADNPELFEDGDIFDPCPECENARHWPQPAANAQFNEYLRTQREVVDRSFESIGTDVITNVFSVIGGRAYEVIDAQTAAALDGVVTIDHYIKDPANMGVYVDYFSHDLGSRTLVGEFGAPIPDINGPMTESQQAIYVDSVLGELYMRRDDVYGANYYVLSEGTTALLNPDGTERKAAQVLRKYFSPAIIHGTATNTIGQPLAGITVSTTDGISKTTTDERGSYTMVIPAEPIQIAFTSDDHILQATMLYIKEGGIVKQNAVLDPYKKNFIYKLRLFLNHPRRN